MKNEKLNLSFKLNLRTKTILIILLTVLALVIIIINSLFIDASSISTKFTLRNLPPSFEHLFGTDWMGRDMLTRTLKGLGLSIQVGAFSSIISTLLGVIIGFLSSFNKYLDSFVN